MSQRSSNPATPPLTKDDSSTSAIAPEHTINRSDTKQAYHFVVRFVSPEIGLGVFAGRDFKRGDLIFQERAIMIATHDSFHSTSTKNGSSVYTALAFPKQNLMRAAFPCLALADGISLPTAYAYLTDIIRNLRGPSEAAAAVEVSIGQYAALPAGRLKIRQIGEGDRDAKIIQWFTAYAFRLPETEGRHQAAVFLVGSLINHACESWNANFNVVGDELRVLARRDVEKGEEIRINYGHARESFECLCDHCHGRRQGAGRQSCLQTALSKVKRGHREPS